MQTLLFAHQILSGECVAGDIFRIPPAVLPPLPTVQSYHAAPIPYPPTDSSPTTQRPQPSHLTTPRVPTEDSAHRGAAGGGVGSGHNHRRYADEQCIQYSPGMLGSWLALVAIPQRAAPELMLRVWHCARSLRARVSQALCPCTGKAPSGWHSGLF